MMMMELSSEGLHTNKPCEGKAITLRIAVEKINDGGKPVFVTGCCEKPGHDANINPRQ
jgi:hypothetical protein